MASSTPCSRRWWKRGRPNAGYCLPGIALRLAAFLSRERDLGDHDVAAALAPQLCRCGAMPGCSGQPYGSRAHGGGGDRLRDEPGPAIPQPELARPRRPWDLSEPGDRSGSSHWGTASSWCGPRRQRVVGHERRCVVAPGPFRSGYGLQWHGRTWARTIGRLSAYSWPKSSTYRSATCTSWRGTLMCARTIWELSGAARCLIRAKRFGGPAAGARQLLADLAGPGRGAARSLAQRG